MSCGWTEIAAHKAKTENKKVNVYTVDWFMVVNMYEFVHECMTWAFPHDFFHNCMVSNSVHDSRSSLNNKLPH